MRAPLGPAACGSPRRGRSARKAPSGPSGLLEVQLALPTIQLILLADVLPHPSLVEAHRAHAITRRPEMQARHPTSLQQLAMDPDGTLALQEPDRVGHAVLRRDAQAPVDRVGHRMPFQQSDPTPPAQSPKERADPTPEPSVGDFPSVLRYDHDVVLALPPHMGRALPFVHRLLLPALRGLPGRWSLCHCTPDRSKLFGSHGQRPWIY